MARRIPPLHPLLFAIYPVLFLFAHNMDEAQLQDIVRPLLVSLGVFLAVYLAALAAMKDQARAAVFTTVCAVMMFAYGNVIAPIRGLEVGGYVVGRSLVLLPIWTLAFGALLVAIARTRRSLQNATTPLTVAAIALTCMAAAKIAAGALHPHQEANLAWKQWVSKWTQSTAASIQPRADLPDIYFIILDEYAGNDSLKNVFKFDNSEFQDYLRSRGFHVAEHSHSNYTFTYVSLASSLNFGYLPDLAREAGAAGLTKPLLASMIENNKLVHLLKSAGYRYYMFPSEYYVTNRNAHADRLYRRLSYGMSDFERVLFSTTMLRPLSAGTRNRRLNRLYVFDKLPEVAALPGPKFVFVHLVMPHVPYVFDRDGNVPKHSLLEKNSYTTAEYRELYVGQMEYLNKRMKGVLDSILDRPGKTRPIVVVQGDHGFRHWIAEPGSPAKQLPPEQRSNILNAMLVPGGPGDDLYDSMTSVNTFRVILNRAFGTDLPLLPDETYLADHTKGEYSLNRVAVWERANGKSTGDKPAWVEGAADSGGTAKEP